MLVSWKGIQYRPRFISHMCTFTYISSRKLRLLILHILVYCIVCIANWPKCIYIVVFFFAIMYFNVVYFVPMYAYVLKYFPLCVITTTQWPYALMYFILCFMTPLYVLFVRMIRKYILICEPGILYQNGLMFIRSENAI